MSERDPDALHRRFQRAVLLLLLLELRAATREAREPVTVSLGP